MSTKILDLLSTIQGYFKLLKIAALFLQIRYHEFTG
jgi:hypothetical protein